MAEKVDLKDHLLQANKLLLLDTDLLNLILIEHSKIKFNKPNLKDNDIIKAILATMLANLKISLTISKQNNKNIETLNTYQHKIDQLNLILKFLND